MSHERLERGPNRVKRLVVRCVSIMAVAGLSASLARAQVALPEQKLSTGSALHHNWPQLGATGVRVFGAWAGLDVPTADVAYAYSLNSGADWTGEATLPLALSGNPMHMPFALSVDPVGGVGLMLNQSGHYFTRRSAVGSATWSPVVRSIVADGHNDDAEVLAADPAASAVYFACTHKLDNYQNTVRLLRSLDNGVNWLPPVNLSSPNCNGSSMVVGPDGALYVTWVDYALGQVLMRKSTDHGANFASPVVVESVLDNLNAQAVGWWTPGVSGQRFYPYYQQGVDEHASAPNFPALAVDRGNGPTRGWLYLTWADRAEGVPSAATTTIRDIEPNDNPASPLADYSNAQLVPLDCDINGSIFGGSDTGPFDFDWYAFDGVAGESILLDGVSSSSVTRAILLQEALPNGERMMLSIVFLPSSNDLATGAHSMPAIVTLPRTGRYLVSLGGGPGGWSYAIRLRKFNVSPSSLARDMRDIILVRSTDGGETWSPKVRVNHDAAGADQSQPNVAVDDQGRVYVAWYDRRGTALGNTVNAYASVSSDGGQTFGPDLKLSSVASEWIRPSSEDIPDRSFPGNMVGDRIAVTAGDNFGMVAWTDLRTFPVASVYAARIVDIPVAVNACSDLSAQPLSAGGVRLRWHVNSVRGLSAIEVLRREGDEEERLVGAAAVPISEGEAGYEDATADPGRAYTYRLRVTSGSDIVFLGPVAIALPARITALACRAAGPNPFADRATLTLAVPRSGAGTVRVYDLQGKVVRTLREGQFEPGELRLEWDGRDASGAEARPGLYFVAAQLGGESVRTKITRVR